MRLYAGTGAREDAAGGHPFSKSSYAKIETNRLNIKVSELVALKNILKCGYDDFFLPCEAEMKED